MVVLWVYIHFMEMYLLIESSVILLVLEVIHITHSTSPLHLQSWPLLYSS